MTEVGLRALRQISMRNLKKKNKITTHISKALKNKTNTKIGSVFRNIYYFDGNTHQHN